MGMSSQSGDSPLRSQGGRTGRLGLAILERRVELADHGVGRVRDDGAEDSRDVTCGRRHSELLELVVALLGLAELLINRCDGGLERPELHHRVGDLTAPERRERLEEAVHEMGVSESSGGEVEQNVRSSAFLCNDGVDTRNDTSRVRRESGLHANLDGLQLFADGVASAPWSERNSWTLYVVQERAQCQQKTQRWRSRPSRLRPCSERRSPAQPCPSTFSMTLESVSPSMPSYTAFGNVTHLEVFVESVLARALHRVTQKGRPDAGVQTPDASLGPHDALPSLHVRLVQVLVDRKSVV